MSEKVINYKCPACTGPLHFSSQSGKLECDYCGSSFTLEDVEAMQSQKAGEAEKAFEEAENQPQTQETWDLSQAGSEWGDEEKKLRAYSCPQCGAELICEETTAATSCPYCGNPTVIPGQLSGSRKPDYIIPFAKSKEDAIAALKKHYSHKPILPKAFHTESHLQEVKGVYVPFWLYSAKVDADMTFSTTRSHSHTTRSHSHTTPDEVITETDHFLVHRQGSLEFDKVPVDGASKMPDGHMDAIEPYDYTGLKPFSMSYLPGFLADKYDVSKDDSSARARARCQTSAENAVRNTVSGYETCVTDRRRLNVHPGSVRYALLPVWLLSTQWQGKNFLFAMNGQTGKLIGELPVSKGKFWAWFAGIFVPLAGAMLWFFV